MGTQATQAFALHVSPPGHGAHVADWPHPRSIAVQLVTIPASSSSPQVFGVQHALALHTSPPGHGEQTFVTPQPRLTAWHPIAAPSGVPACTRSPSHTMASSSDAASSPAELFWAMRGAGANFGVVTGFRYRLHPLPVVLAGLLLHPRERAAELIAFYREYLKETPDELDTTLGFLNGPDGTPLVGVVAVYAGDVAEGEEVLRPLRQ